MLERNPRYVILGIERRDHPVFSTRIAYRTIDTYPNGDFQSSSYVIHFKLVHVFAVFLLYQLRGSGERSDRPLFGGRGRTRARALADGRPRGQSAQRLRHRGGQDAPGDSRTASTAFGSTRTPLFCQAAVQPKKRGARLLCVSHGICSHVRRGVHGDFLTPCTERIAVRGRT